MDSREFGNIHIYKNQIYNGSFFETPVQNEFNESSIAFKNLMSKLAKDPLRTFSRAIKMTHLSKAVSKIEQNIYDTTLRMFRPPELPLLVSSQNPVVKIGGTSFINKDVLETQLKFHVTPQNELEPILSNLIYKYIDKIPDRPLRQELNRIAKRFDQSIQSTNNEEEGSLTGITAVVIVSPGNEGSESVEQIPIEETREEQVSIEVALDKTISAFQGWLDNYKGDDNVVVQTMKVLIEKLKSWQKPLTTTEIETFYDKEDVCSLLRVQINIFRDTAKQKWAEHLNKVLCQVKACSPYIGERELLSFFKEMLQSDKENTDQINTIDELVKRYGMNLPKLSNLVQYVSVQDFLTSNDHKSAATKVVEKAMGQSSKPHVESIVYKEGAENTREILVNQLLKPMRLNKYIVPKIPVSNIKALVENRPLSEGIGSPFISGKPYQSLAWESMVKNKKQFEIALFQLSKVQLELSENKIDYTQHRKLKKDIKSIEMQIKLNESEIDKLKPRYFNISIHWIQRATRREEMNQLEVEISNREQAVKELRENLNNLNKLLDDSRSGYERYKNAKKELPIVEEGLKQAQDAYGQAQEALNYYEFLSTLPEDIEKKLSREEILFEMNNVQKWKGSSSINSHVLADLILCSSDSHIRQFILNNGNLENIDFARYLTPSEVFVNSQGAICLIFRSALLDHPFTSQPLSPEEQSNILSWDVKALGAQWNNLGLIGDKEFFDHSTKHLLELSEDISAISKSNYQELEGFAIKYDFEIKPGIKEEGIKQALTDKIKNHFAQLQKICFSKIHPKAFRDLKKRIHVLQKYVRECQTNNTPPTLKEAFSRMYPRMVPFMKVAQRLMANPGSLMAISGFEPRSLQSIIDEAKQDGMATNDEIKEMEQALEEYKKEAPSIEDLGTTIDLMI